MIRFISLFIVFALTSGIFVASVFVGSAFADKKMDKTIRDYLMKNPEVVMEVIENAVQHDRAKKEAQKQDTLKKARPELARLNLATIAQGQGDLTLVEFFDYQCGFCKKAFPQVSAALKKDKNIRFIYKEFPILGKPSTLAARAAVAARKQRKYKKFHTALMTTPGRLTKDKVWSIAKSIGLDVKRLKKDMQSKKIEEALTRNFDLARKLGISGTPTFILFNDKKIVSISGIQSERELTALFSSFRAAN